MPYVFTVEIAKTDHPITKGMPATFEHSVDELYQNSLLFPDCDVIVTSWSDPAKDPKNTGKHEPSVWVTKHGEGRVCNNALGHDVAAMQDKGFQTLLIRGVEWAATGEAKTPVPAELKKQLSPAVQLRYGEPLPIANAHRTEAEEGKRERGGRP